MILPETVSTKNIFPGCNLPFLIIFEDSIGKTPDSLAKITKPSSVTQNLPGLKPFRSRTAPINEPSVKVTHAGPSQGSMNDA